MCVSNVLLCYYSVHGRVQVQKDWCILAVGLTEELQTRAECYDEIRWPTQFVHHEGVALLRVATRFQ